jgi:hypothetical protein
MRLQSVLTPLPALDCAAESKVPHLLSTAASRKRPRAAESKAAQQNGRHSCFRQIGAIPIVGLHGSKQHGYLVQARRRLLARSLTANSSCQLSEIRLVRSREHGFLSGGVVRVFCAFGADIFHPHT